MDDLKARLDRIEENQHDMQQSLADISAAAKQMNGTVIDILAEIGDAPSRKLRGGRPTLRDRLHTLENDSAAAVAGKAALTAANAMRSQAWNRREKVGLFAFSAIAATGVVLRLFGVG